MTEAKARLRREIPLQPVDEERLRAQILVHRWFQQAKTVMAYCAIRPEVDLTAVLETILASGKTLVLPRCEGKGVMTARVIKSLTELQRGGYGIMEPGKDTPEASGEDIDLVLVPGLAFDRACHRLGRGMGYYDRFLKEYRGKTMGICRSLVPTVPVEPHDITLDAVVTAEQIFYRTEANLCLRKS